MRLKTLQRMKATTDVFGRLVEYITIFTDDG